MPVELLACVLRGQLQTFPALDDLLYCGAQLIVNQAFELYVSEIVLSLLDKGDPIASVCHALAHDL